MTGTEPTQERIDRTFARLDKDAEAGGYHLNPDSAFTKDLVFGLLVNESRYGYWACPCRIAEGNKGEDLDIICPCDYRDPDLEEHGACYCALYVDDDIKSGKKKARPIPERRPPEEERKRLREEKDKAATAGVQLGKLKYPIWRCTVCGYICARDDPPLVCPVCKAKKDRFERFL